jgi:hypothetical protein
MFTKSNHVPCAEQTHTISHLQNLFIRPIVIFYSHLYPTLFLEFPVNVLCVSCFIDVYMSFSPHTTWCNHPNNIKGWVQTENMPYVIFIVVPLPFNLLDRTGYSQRFVLKVILNWNVSKLWLILLIFAYELLTVSWWDFVTLYIVTFCSLVALCMYLLLLAKNNAGQTFLL